MTTNLTPELSTKNEYWISKHKYYELVHFCLQYKEWKKLYSVLSSITTIHSKSFINIQKTRPSTTLEDVLAIRSDLLRRMRLVEHTALATDAIIGPYIFEAVTENKSYYDLDAKYHLPCGRDAYYNLYRKFFWLLEKER